MTSSFRRVRVLFSGLTTLPDLLSILERLHEMGELISHKFDYTDAGHGEAVLLTSQSHKQLQEYVTRGMHYGFGAAVEDLPEENGHDQPETVS